MSSSSGHPLKEPLLDGPSSSEPGSGSQESRNPESKSCVAGPLLETKSREPLKADLSAHLGLRGVLTLWIVVFHSLLYSSAGFVNLQGSSLMTAFFLLSGFSLVSLYGRYEPSSQRAGGCCSGTKRQCAKRQWARFLRNRAARIFPVFWVCNALAAITLFTGWGECEASTETDLALCIFNSASGLYTWSCFVFGAAFDGPAWTVSTLLFMYLAFPLILHVFDTCKCLQRPLGLRLVAWGSFCVQAVVAIWLQLQFGSFYVATMTPWSRAGVFVMGMAAARFAQVQHWLSRGRVIAFVSHEGAPPKPAAVTVLCGSGRCCKKTPWSSSCCADLNAVLLVVGVVYFSLIDSFIASGLLDNNDTHVFEDIPLLSGGAFWFQIINAAPFLQMLVCMAQELQLSVAATKKMPLATQEAAPSGPSRVNESSHAPQVSRSHAHPSVSRVRQLSLVSRFCMLPAMQWLGGISLSVYLAHQVLLYFLCAFYNVVWLGAVNTTFQEFNKTTRQWENHTVASMSQGLTFHQIHGSTLPPWGVCIVLPLAVLVGWGLTEAIEKPCRKLIRGKSS